MSLHSSVPNSKMTSAPQSIYTAAFQSLHLTGTFSVGTVFRLVTNLFTTIAIILLIVGPCTLSWYRPGSAIVAFPLVFLFISLLSHMAVAAHYLLTTLVHIEWRGPSWQTQSGQSLPMPERLKHLERLETWALMVAHGGAALGIACGALLVALYPRCNAAMVAGVVFAFLSATMHMLFAVVPEKGYCLTLTLWKADQETNLRDGYVQFADEDLDAEPIDMKSLA
ncbi:hypothetical protein MMC11_003587 [Xylographa trunciseda]|nr:hypothetical protein [Xylographa trunciseda]